MHQGGGYVRMEAPPTNSWTEDVNANCHGIFNLKSINCIPLSNFLTTPLKVNVDAATHTIYNVGKIYIGSAVDDGSGALLQVRGEINAQSYMINGVEFASSSVPGTIDLTNINNINGQSLPDFVPGGIDGSVQFNDEGKFDGDGYFIYNEISHSLIVGLQSPSSPAWQFEVGGDINIVDPTYLGYAYRINGIPFAIANSNGATIDLVNISTINGLPPGGGGSGTPTNVVGGTCISVDNSIPGTAVVNANIGCIQTPWRQNIDAAAFYLNNCGGLVFAGGQSLNDTGGGVTGFTLNGGVGLYIKTTLYDVNVSGNRNIGLEAITGNVGITHSLFGYAPAYLLDVDGDARARGCFYIGAALPLVSLCNDGAGNLLVNGAPISGGASVIISDTPPVAPEPGDLWFDSTDTQLYIWYQDPTSSQWVATINQCGLIGDAPVDGNIYGRENGAWTQIISGAPTTPAPPNQSVQWNNNGVFGGSANFVYDNTNIRVGIGTATPTYNLDLIGGTNLYVARFTNSGTFCGIIIDHTDTPGGESVVSFRSAGMEAAVIEYDSDEDNLIFWTGARDAANSTMCCDTNSNVGIGTTSPQAKLDSTGMIRVTDTNPVPTSGAGLEMFYDTTIPKGFIDAYDRGASTYQRLEINANPLTLCMNGGNVGIGNTGISPFPGMGYTHLIVGNQTPLPQCGIITACGNTTTVSGPVGYLGFCNYAIVAPEKRIADIFCGIDGAAINSGIIGFHVYQAGVVHEVMRMTPAGYVGIGTGSPQGPLDVMDSIGNVLIRGVQGGSGEGVMIYGGYVDPAVYPVSTLSFQIADATNQLYIRCKYANGTVKAVILNLT